MKTNIGQLLSALVFMPLSLSSTAATCSSNFWKRLSKSSFVFPWAARLLQILISFSWWLFTSNCITFILSSFIAMCSTFFASKCWQSSALEPLMKEMIISIVLYYVKCDCLITSQMALNKNSVSWPASKWKPVVDHSKRSFKNGLLSEYYWVLVNNRYCR